MMRCIVLSSSLQTSRVLRRDVAPSLFFIKKKRDTVEYMGFLRIITPKFLLSWYHFSLTFLSALLYRFPSRNLIVIGVTGTNGKSTTVHMITRIFKEAGFKTASVSSIRFQIGDKEWRNELKMTMPGRFMMQKFLRQAVEAECEYAVIEVTSEGILQHRHRFINFHTAVFTNLSPEHIERHGGFENYKKTKGKLFQITKKVHVINKDDEHAEYFLQFPAEKIYRYNNTVFPVRLKLLGEFNKYNAAAAISVGRAHGISLEVCTRVVENIKGIPGRMEEVISEPFRVVVDYAFTPAALEKVYKTLKPENGKLLCVLGAAGGGRDSWKRPVLGKIAAQHCDTIILTDEDPYEEDPMQIINTMAEGTEGKDEKILDRRKAIKRAMGLASSGDTIVITGKGSEDSMAIKGGKKIPWDDRQTVREEFQKMDK